MEYRKLGQADIDVSVIALGCWPFAGGTVWGEQHDEVSVATVHAALDAGINFFDTAEGYESGRSDRVLGRGLEGRRHEGVIATKVSPNHLTPEEIAAACEESLRNLRTDYIDLYQIHWPNHEIPIETTWRALEDLVAAGKVRALGVANFASGDLADLLAVGSLAADQMPYSLLWRGIEYEVLPLCRERGVGLVCYAPLAQGLLTGRYREATEVPDGLARTRWYSGERQPARHCEPGCEEEVFAAVAEMREIGERVGAPMASVALAWVLKQQGVTSVLVGARNAVEFVGAGCIAGRWGCDRIGPGDRVGERSTGAEPGYVVFRVADALSSRSGIVALSLCPAGSAGCRTGRGQSARFSFPASGSISNAAEISARV